MENVELYFNLIIIGTVAGFLLYLFFSAIAEGIAKVVNLIDIK